MAPPSRKGELRSSAAVVIPCYNAGNRLRPVVERACEYVARVIVVDDGSTDGTLDVLRGIPVQTIRFDRNQGKGLALLAGFRAALELPEATAVCTCDADGQHDPRELPGLYDVFVEQHADLVIGARTFDSRDVPWPSRLGNTLTVSISGWLLKQWLPDTQSGYRIHSRRLVEAVLQTVSGGRYETEMEIVILAAHGGFHITSAPIRTIYEEGNRSSHFHKFWDSLRIYRILWQAAWRRKW